MRKPATLRALILPFTPKRVVEAPPERHSFKWTHLNEQMIHKIKNMVTAGNQMKLPDALGALGALEVRLAKTKREIRKAQRLRYKIFFEEGAARPSAKARLTRRDADRFDKFCDHLIVIDHDARGKSGRPKSKIVAVYRLLRSAQAKKAGGFYSAGEYDLAPLLSRHKGKNILELGRSCVHKDYRGKRAIEALWRGLLAYIRKHDIDALIGCASFEGANPLIHASALSWIAHNAVAGDEWRVSPRVALGGPLDILSNEAVDARRALAAMPPLIKGYLRVGAKFGDGYVVDRAFNTVDVFVVMPIAEMDARYIEYFSTRDAA
jgi:putative hemolysin